MAYLLYKHRDKVTPQNIIIFSPNQIFNDYISNVLPQLGEDNMLRTTFREYMHKALGEALKKEDYYDMMEYILGSKDKPDYPKRIHSFKFKSSVEFADILEKFAASVETKERNFTDIIFGDKLIISAKDLEKLYYNDYSKLPLNKRLHKIRERILFLLKPYEKDKVQVKAITNEDEEYMNDAVIIPAYLAKGLEFDVVLIYNAGDGNHCCEEERLLLYTACTRALHVLCVYYSGRCTSLLRGERYSSTL